MKPPEGFIQNIDLVGKLKKSIHGTKQASYCWNKRFKDLISNLGFKRSLSDHCLYIKVVREVYIYLLIYVNDILIIGYSEESIREIILVNY